MGMGRLVLVWFRWSVIGSGGEGDGAVPPSALSPHRREGTGRERVRQEKLACSNGWKSRPGKG